MPRSEVPCPVCSVPLVFDASALVRGEKITCARCDTAIGIEPGGSTRKTLDNFAAARKTLPGNRKAG